MSNYGKKVLIYGDLIDSRKLTYKQMSSFWKIVSLKNKDQDFIVPFCVFLGDAFHGIVAENQYNEWIAKFRKHLDKNGIKARYIVIPVKGDFSSINTVKKYNKKSIIKCKNTQKLPDFLFHKNLLNIPELRFADQEMSKIKSNKKDNVVVLKELTKVDREKYHSLMTIEYCNS